MKHRSLMFPLPCLLIFWASLNVGCKKYLDVKSNSARVTPNTLKSFQELLDDSYVMNFASNSLAEASADDYFITQTAYSSVNENARKVYTWSNFVYYHNNDWAAGYLPVYNTNLVLEGLEKIERTAGNAAQWDALKGSALVYRGNQFLTMVWAYGKAYDSTRAGTDLGIALRTSADPTVPTVRATLEATYRQITSDLTESLRYLPPAASHPMRPSLTAAYGLLARAYLSMAIFDSARHYAGLALAGSASLMDYNLPGLVNVPASFPFKRFNSETIFYTQLKTYQVTLGSSYALVDTALYSMYDVNDLRRTAYFAAGALGYQRFKGSYTGVNDLFSGVTTAEMYLIRAECNARLGEREKALQDLGTLLAYRWKTGTFTPLTAATDAEAVSMVLVERRKELLMRGLRWSDIKRLNLLSPDIVIRRIVDGNIISLPPNDNRYALPLPTDIISTTGMPQNEP